MKIAAGRRGRVSAAAVIAMGGWIVLILLSLPLISVYFQWRMLWRRNFSLRIFFSG